MTGWDWLRIGAYSLFLAVPLVAVWELLAYVFNRLLPDYDETGGMSDYDGGEQMRVLVACEQAPLRRRTYKQPVCQKKRDFTNFVRATFPAVLRQTGLTCPQIARQAGVPFETAKSWWRGKALPRGYVLINLARANSLVSAWMDLCAGKYQGDPETQAIADRMIGRLERT